MSPSRTPRTSARRVLSSNPSGGKSTGCRAASSGRRSSPLRVEPGDSGSARPASDANTDGSIAEWFNAQHSGKMSQFVHNGVRRRLTKNDRDVFPLEVVELDIGQLIDGVDPVPAHHQNRDCKSHGERRKKCANTTSVEIANDHARRRRQESPQPKPFDEP